MVMDKNSQHISIGDPVIIKDNLEITRSRYGVNDRMHEMIGENVVIKEIRSDGDFRISFGQYEDYLFAQEDVTIFPFIENSSTKQKETVFIFNPEELII